MSISKILSITFLLILSTLVQANPLSQNDIDSYVKSFDLLKNSSDPIIQSLEDELANSDSFQLDTDENGQIAIASQVIKTLPPNQKEALEDIADDAGFASVEQWASVADKVASALMALEMSEEDTEMDMSEFSPEELENAPPQMREQIEGILRVMTALKSVPKQDIALVEKNYAKLSRLMDE